MGVQQLFPKVIHTLVIEDEEYDVRRLRNTLRHFEDQIVIEDVVANGDSALEILEQRKNLFDIVIMDLKLASGIMGEPLIRAIKRVSPSVQIIVMTKMTINVTDFGFANGLLKAGAFWYCTKYPSDIEDYIYQPTDFILSIFNAYQRRKLEHEQSKSMEKLLKDLDEKIIKSRILGISVQTQKLRAQIKQVATSDATVLISGSSGTGKELVARNIHYESKRKLENFVAISCGSIPIDLIESELFGYEQGAFTGATSGKVGLIETAHHGTLFLDEISELPPPAQVKLLRVIQEGEIEKIGRTERIKVDVRIIAATNKVLQKEISAGRFREDLFYRLNVVPIYTPQLGERPEDIPVLWEYFVHQISAAMGRPVIPTENGAFQLLMKYPWPGNVRELKNVIQRLLLMQDAAISPEVVREVLFSHPRPSNHVGVEGVFFDDANSLLPLRDMEMDFRLKYFQFVRKNSASDAEAAKKLGLAPPNYHRMCKELGLKL